MPAKITRHRAMFARQSRDVARRNINEPLLGNPALLVVFIFQPPVINNLPHILEILETTRTSVPLIQINVTDATNDEICCTLPFTLPNTFNFKLVTYLLCQLKMMHSD